MLVWELKVKYAMKPSFEFLSIDRVISHQSSELGGDL